MNNFIIKKWIEPYRLLETVKKNCDYTDLTFDGMNKIQQKTKMLSALESDNKKFALYMKNVNKFYVFKQDEELDLTQILTEIFNFRTEDYEYSNDVDYALNLIDIGKAEASFLNIKNS